MRVLSWIDWVEKDATILRCDGSWVVANLFKDITGSVYFVCKQANRRVYVDKAEQPDGSMPWAEIKHQVR